MEPQKESKFDYSSLFSMKKSPEKMEENGSKKRRLESTGREMQKSKISPPVITLSDDEEQNVELPPEKKPRLNEENGEKKETISVTINNNDSDKDNDGRSVKVNSNMKITINSGNSSPSLERVVTMDNAQMKIDGGVKSWFMNTPEWQSYLKQHGSSFPQGRKGKDHRSQLFKVFIRKYYMETPMPAAATERTKPIPISETSATSTSVMKPEDHSATSSTSSKTNGESTTSSLVNQSSLARRPILMMNFAVHPMPPPIPLMSVPVLPKPSPVPLIRRGASVPIRPMSPPAAQYISRGSPESDEYLFVRPITKDKIIDAATQTIKKGHNYVIVITGPKNIGKSTVGRFMMNHFLRMNLSVFHLDCDPGQTEFTPPGCLSLTKVVEPVYGLPFDHMRMPVRCKYFGDVSPADRFEEYIDCIQRLLKEFDGVTRTSSPSVLLVNTCGWINGAGLCALVEIIQNARPNFTLMLKPNRGNDQRDADAAYARIEQTLSQMVNQDQYSRYSPCHSTIERVSDKSRMHYRCRDFSSADFREATVLAYFGIDRQFESTNDLKMATENLSVIIRTQTPYMIHMNEIYVGFTAAAEIPSSHFLSILNTSIVALCRYEKSDIVDDGNDSQPDDEHWCNDPMLPMVLDRENVFDANCYGFGIVRAIDMETGMFYLVTPLPLEELSRVNAFVKGDLALPPAIFIHQQMSTVQLGRSQVMPYVIIDKANRSFHRPLYLKSAQEIVPNWNGPSSSYSQSSKDAKKKKIASGKDIPEASKKETSTKKTALEKLQETKKALMKWLTRKRIQRPQPKQQPSGGEQRREDEPKETPKDEGRPIKQESHEKPANVEKPKEDKANSSKEKEKPPEVNVKKEKE